MVIKLTARQESSFRAILDTYIAPLTTEEERALVAENASCKDVDLNALADTAGTDEATAVENGIRFLENAGLPSQYGQILFIFTLLSTTLGTFLLTGYWMALTDMPRIQREAVLLSWKASWIPVFRQLYKLFGYMSLFPGYGYSNTLRAAIGYPHVNGMDPAEPKEKVASHQVKDAYKMLSVEEASALQVDQVFDAIVVGSGAGGGVIAAQVAAAGKSVLVIEKGKYYQDAEFGPDETSGFKKVYESEGLYASKEGSLGLVGGATFGGGTTVNWAASLKPHDYVLDEWAQVTDNLFDKEAFKKDVEVVVKRIGATTEGIHHSNPNRLLKEGSTKLGYDVKDIPQNTQGLVHDCKVCFVGCRDGVKQGTANTWLRDAEQHGAKFMVETEVTQVLTKNGRAHGVECIHIPTGTTLRFEATVVVAAGGSMHTPNLLRRSGLKNQHLGQHLRVHPATIIQGVYPTNQDMYDGPIMTVVCDVPNADDHFGAKIEVPSVHPALAAIGVPWRGALDHKQTMARYRRTVPFVVIGRDKDSVSSVGEEKGKLAVSYKMSKHDARTMVNGVVHGFKVMAVTGARELYHSQNAVEPFRFDSHVEPSDTVNDPKFNAWLDRIVKNGMPDGVFTAHLMGTCRMGKNAKVSATQVTGETWEVGNLFVGDGSLFISASGVNPMVTIETLALGVSRQIIKRLNQC